MSTFWGFAFTNYVKLMRLGIVTRTFQKIWGYGPPQPITLAHFKPQTRNIKAADTQGVLKVRHTLREI